MEDKIEKIKDIVQQELSCSAHDLEHSKRAYNNCIKLAENESVNLTILKAAALLHDIARTEEDKDQTGNTDHALLGAEKAEKILKELDFSKEEIGAIKHCIISHRFRNNQEPKTKEAQILFDADKIDSVGAIGIARSFIWVGKNNAKMYTDIDIEKYINDNLGGDPNSRIRNKTKHSPQIEFETKFKNLANSLYTEKGRKLCQERIDFYKNFLNQLEKEILE